MRLLCARACAEGLITSVKGAAMQGSAVCRRLRSVYAIKKLLQNLRNHQAQELVWRHRSEVASAALPPRSPVMAQGTHRNRHIPRTLWCILGAIRVVRLDTQSKQAVA